MRTEVTVPDARLDRFRERVDEISRRAERLGGSPLLLEEIRRGPKEYRVFRRVFEQGTWQTIETVKAVPATTFAVRGEFPALEGWQLLARADIGRAAHASEAAITSYGPPRAEIQRLLNGAADGKGRLCCAHCGTARNRRQVFFVRAASGGEAKAVGSDCVQDFTGIDIAAAVRRYDAVLSALAEAAGTERAQEFSILVETDWDGYLAAIRAQEAAEQSRKVDLAAYLAHCADQVAQGGWVSSKRAEAQGVAATWQEALIRAGGGSPPSDWGMGVARQVLAWIPRMGFREDGLWKLKRTVEAALAGDGRVRPDEARLLAFAVVQAAAAEGFALAGEFVGDVDQRLALPLKLVGVESEDRRFRDAYGRDRVQAVRAVQFVDAEGRRYQWETGAGHGGAPGAWFDCKGTVSGHVVNGRGEAVTCLSRVKVGPEIPPPAPPGPAP